MSASGPAPPHPPARGLRRKRIEDLATLRALAHPLRMQLLGALRTQGPATASELGRRFGETSGSTSYHLRQLARYGFVEEAPDQPSRRERVWRAAHELTAWDNEDFIDEEAGRSALAVLQRQRLLTQTVALQRWYAARATWPRPWVRAAEDSDVMLRLTADELAELTRELSEVVQRWLEGRGPRDRREATRRVHVYLQAFPVPDEEVP